MGESEAHNISHETRAINSALTALCDVMQTLSKNARLGAMVRVRVRVTYPNPNPSPNPNSNPNPNPKPGPKAAQLVPYRNHKLTRLLGDSLGGNSTTLMLAAVHQVPERLGLGPTLTLTLTIP